MKKRGGGQHQKMKNQNCVNVRFLRSGELDLIFDIFEAWEGLGGFQLDEIEAANSFPMLSMARG